MRISDWSSDVCSSDLKQNIAFGQFDAVALDVAIAQAFVMVVHRNRQITLGRILPYDIAIEEGFDFLRCGQFVADRIASRFLALFDDDVIAQVDAFIANKDRKSTRLNSSH